MSTAERRRPLVVKESLKKIVRAPQLKSVLDKFHQKLESLGFSVKLEDSVCTFLDDKQQTPDLAADLVTEFLLGKLRCGGFLELDVTAASLELVKELDNRRWEVFTNLYFLQQFSNMLENSSNSDDPMALAGLCLRVQSVLGNNPGLASIGEIQSPELIIEVTKGFIKLTNLNPPMKPPSAEPVASEPVTEKKKPKVISNYGEAFQQKMEELGVCEKGRKIIDQVKRTKNQQMRYERLDAFIEKHGEDIALVALYRSASVIVAGNEPTQLIDVINKVKSDTATLKKYKNLTELLMTELDVPLEGVCPLLFNVKTSIREDLAIENINLLLSCVPKEELRYLLLTSPSKLVLLNSIREILKVYPPKVDIDEEQLVQDLIEYSEGRRSEAYIRNYIHENLQLFVNKSLEVIWRQLTFSAISLQNQADNNDIPKEFTLKCIEEGDIDVSTIVKKYQTKDPGNNPGNPKPITDPQEETAQLNEEVENLVQTLLELRDNLDPEEAANYPDEFVRAVIMSNMTSFMRKTLNSSWHTIKLRAAALFKYGRLVLH
jgi:hypothetical protein